MDETNRREFLRSGSAALVAAQCSVTALAEQQNGLDVESAPANQGHPLVVPGYYGSQVGIQIGTQLPPNAGDEDMQFARQLGVEWVMTSLPPKDHNLENYLALKRRFAA